MSVVSWGVHHETCDQRERIVTVLAVLAVVCGLATVAAVASAQTSRPVDKGVVIGPARKTAEGGQRWALIVGIND